MTEKEKEEWGETVKVTATDNSDEWGETVVVSSPKSPAPSKTGGESGAYVRPITPSTSPSTSTLPSAGLESESWTKTINPLAGKPIAAKPTAKPVDAVQTNKIVEPKKTGEYKPLVQENIQKIEGMTMGVKFPEYSKPSTKQTFDFKQASQEAVSEEQKAEKEQTLKRKEQRRIDNLPSEIESLRKERADLLLDRSPEAKRKLAANQAVTEKMQSDLDNISKSKYESLQNLNQKAIKNVELEINEYLENNPKLRDEIKVKGLTDSETYALVQQSVAKKIAPLEADLQTFQQEGTVENARKKVEISGNLQSKQKKIEGLAEQLKSYQDEYLKKAGFSDLNNQLNSSMQALKKYEPYLNKAKAEAIGYKKELTQIESKLNAYQSKIEGNSFNGTQQELNDYKALKKDYNETINEFNNVYENESLNGYEEAVNNYNSLAAKRSSIVKGLQNNEYNTIKTQYDAQIAEYDLALNDYKKFEEPEIKDRINKYFSTVQQIGDYDQKVKTTRGELASIDELERAKKIFSNAGGGTDVLDIGGRAVNSILGAAKKLVASPFRIAGSISDVYGSGGDVYHYSDFVADLIEGKGSEPLFLTKEKNVFYDSVTDKINWGAVPVLASMADQAGVLLVLALTGKYATPTVASAMTTAGTDLTAAAEIAESAKIATTIAPAFMISYGDNYKEALDKGFSAGGAMAYSGALSFLEGLTETILPDQDLLFGKGAKEMMLNRFIKDYAKGKNFAIKNMTNDFLFNAFGEATEEAIAALGKTAATSIGHLVDKNIEIEIPTMNQNITTSITAGLTGGGMGIVGSVSENSQMYKMGVMQLANDFETGKALLSKLNEKGKIDDKRYNKLISDVQKFQSVRGQIPEGLSGFKTMAVFEKMIAIKELSAQMDKDKTNPFNKINAKKISAIQDEIEKIVDDKNFDARAEYELNLEAEELGKPQEEKQETSVNPTLQKNTSSTPERWGTINRNDGKGIIDLTKEEFEAEQAKMQQEAEETAPAVEQTEEQIANNEFLSNEIVLERQSLEKDILSEEEFIKETEGKKGKIRKFADKLLGKNYDEYLKNQKENLSLLNKDPLAYYEKKLADRLEFEKNNPEDANEQYVSSIKDVIDKIKQQQATPKVKAEKSSAEVEKLRAEGAVTATPIENPKVLIQGTRQGLETFESSNYDSKADGKVTDARGLKFDENGVSIQKDNKGNQIVHIKVDATDDFSRRGNLQVSVIVPEGTNVNTKAIKEIVDAKVAEIKAKGNEELRLGKVQQSDFTALKDAIVNELKNPSAAKSKVTAAPNVEPTVETKIEEDVNIQQPMGESKVDDGAVGDVAKEDGGKEGSVGVGGDNPALKDETPILSTPKILSTNGLPNLEIVASKEASQALESEIGGDKGVIDKNVRTIPIQEYDVASNKRSKQIAEQIEENGWIEPLIVSYDKNGNVYIVEGQHRAAALKELGYDKAPVIVIHEKDLGKQSLKETPITEEKEAVEGSTVKLPPSMKGGMERTMVFKDGEWQQSVGGSPTKVGDKVKAEADEAFKASQKAEPTEVITETETTPTVEAPKVESEELSNESNQELKRIEGDISASESKIEDFKSEIEIEKGNLKEEKARIKQEKAKVRASSMSKKEKVERLEELDAELEDIINDHDDLVQQYRDDIAQEKSDIKDLKKEKAAIERKAAEKKQKVEPVKEEKIIPAGKRLFNEPNPETAEISKQFKKENGIDTPEGENITEIDQDNSKKIADAYEEMKDSPDDPIVQKAYQELADQTADQHQALIDAGYEVELWEGEGEPYKNAQEMINDVRNNKHMYIFSTESGYGDSPITDKQRSQNKMLQDSGFKDKNGKRLLYNDIFRFVHDKFGHNERGNGFGAIGEENAWDVHYRMYKSPLARRALTTETRGQNSWVNFGKHMRNPDGSIKTAKDQGYVSPKDRPFAEQKMGLLPEWASENKYLEKDLENQKKSKSKAEEETTEKTEEAPKKTEREVIQEYVDMYDSMREEETTSKEKREMAEKMKQMLDENPNLKLIFDNIKNINKSLEAQGLITKTIGCP